MTSASTMRTCLVSMSGELRNVRATERTSCCARSMLSRLANQECREVERMRAGLAEEGSREESVVIRTGFDDK